MSEPEADWHTGAVIISDQLGCRIRLGQNAGAARLYHILGIVRRSASEGSRPLRFLAQVAAEV